MAGKHEKKIEQDPRKRPGIGTPDQRLEKQRQKDAERETERYDRHAPPLPDR